MYNKFQLKQSEKKADHLEHLRKIGLTPLNVPEIVKSPKNQEEQSLTDKFKEKEEKERLQAIESRNLDMQNKSQFRIQ